MAITPGTRLGPYEIAARLGAGGMGEVFRAHDPRIGRDVAIKVLPAAFAADESRLRRFEQEARTAGSLNHPHLVTIYDIGREGGTSFIVMELLDGVTLRDRLATDGSDLKKNLLGLADAADAVAAAHHAGIVHRDLKPENIMVTASGFTKVLDFGLAKLAAESPLPDDAETTVARTGSGVVLGTVGYMSPEQAMGKPADHRADIFALGCILYEVVTGRRAFAGRSSVDTLHAIIHSDPPAVRTLRPDVPSELQRIVRKCLTKDPDERYQSAKDLAIDLRAAVRELGSTAETAAVGAPRRRPIPWAVAAAIVVAALAAGAVWFARKRGAAAAPHPVTIRPLTTSGEVISAAISPDAKYIAYATSSEGRQALYLRQIDGTQSVTLLPPFAGGLWGQAFTPDGGAIVYGVKTRGAGAAAVNALYRIPLLGGTPRHLLDTIDSQVSFSPDGSRFAYLRADYPKPGQSAVMVANADGSNEHPLAVRTAPVFFAPIFFAAPAWSPDGKVIITAELRWAATQRGRLVALDVASGEAKPLTHDAWRSVAQAVWLPGGSGLVAAGAPLEEPTTQLYRVDYPSGDVHALTSGLTDWRNPSVSADGTKVVAVGTTVRSSMMLLPQSAPPRRISETQFDGIHSFAFLPDGRVVFSTVNGGSIDVMIANGDGSQRQQVTLPSAVAREVAATSDGRMVCVVADSRGTGVWSMAPDGSGALRLADATSTAVPAPSPNGSEIYFDSNFGDGDIIYRVPRSGGKPQPVSRVHAIRPAVSPDGRQLAAFVKLGAQAPHLGIIDVATGALVRDFPQAVQGTVSRCRWSRDGKSVYYNAASSLLAVPAAGGEPREVVHYDAPNVVYRFDFAPDGTLGLVYGLLARDAYLITGAD